MVAAYGSLDVLVNNAGVIQVGPVEHMTVRDFEDAMADPLLGNALRDFGGAHLRRNPTPRIVNTSSIGGKLAVPHLVPYSAASLRLPACRRDCATS